jgi:glycosyltransferase involved in cell wall biosynthesis
MKVAIIGSRGYPYVYSGYETLVRELAERLVGSGVQVRVYCHHHLFEEHPDQVNGVKLTYLRTTKGKNTAQLIHSLQSMLHACFSSADCILVVNAANGPFGIISRLFGKKTAINVDGLEWLRPKWKGLGARYFYWAAKAATKLYDVVVTDAEAMRQYYLEEFSADSTVIAYGAYIQHARQHNRLQRFHLRPNEYFLIVGRLIPDNNAAFICEEFLKTRTHKKLVIIGDVPYADSYASAIKKLGEKDQRLVFTGYVRDQDELAELYCNAFAYLHGHEYGGTNPTLLKALGFGCMVLALDTVFSREVLEDGQYGLFFDKSPGTLSSLLDALSEDEKLLEQYRSRAQDRIALEYSWEKIANQYLALFQSLIQ